MIVKFSVFGCAPPAFRNVYKPRETTPTRRNKNAGKTDNPCQLSDLRTETRRTFSLQPAGNNFVHLISPRLEAACSLKTHQLLVFSHGNVQVYKRHAS